VKANVEVTKDKIKSNLEYLLSQNDILPLLKKLGKDKSKLDPKFSLDRANRNVRVLFWRCLNFHFSNYMKEFFTVI